MSGIDYRKGCIAMLKMTNTDLFNMKHETIYEQFVVIQSSSAV